jgi:hypothetical protein
LLEILKPAVGADGRLPVARADLRIVPLGVPFGLRRDFMLSLPCPGFTALTVHTTAGHLVATPFRGWLSAGDHQVHWYPAEARGGATAAGVYILTVESGPGVASTLTVHLP